MKNKIVLIFTVLIIISGCVTSSTPSGIEAEVLDVVDGDTVKTTLGTVRVLGINTPELSECNGYEAKIRVEDLLKGKEKIYLENDSLADDTDRYGRLLRYIILPDGRDMGLILVEEGWANSFRYDSSTGYPYEKEDLYHNHQGILKINMCSPTSTPVCSGMVFDSCAEMKDAGCAPAIQGEDDWYNIERDGDGDGIACE